MVKLLLVLVSVIAASYVSDAYKILAIFPMPAKSHNILGTGVIRYLMNAGHEVTYVTPYPKHKTTSNYHEVDLSSNQNIMPKERMNITNIMLNQNNDWLKNYLFFVGLMVATKSIEHENFQKFLADKSQKFDLVISEWMFSELYAGIAKIYDAPLIWFLSIEPHWMILSTIDEYLNPAYNTYDVEELPPLTFTHRLQELWFTIKQTVLRETVILYMTYEEHYRLIVPHIESRRKTAPSFQELRYSASLVLGNSHVSMGQATRLPQNYKPVGGFHIDDNVTPLPEDLKKIIEEAKHGVIYFSMGSNLSSKDIPVEIKAGLIKLFATLKQTVIWKFEEDLPGKPKNVHILKWAPQQSILAHSNVLMFITHGGLLSTTEAIYAGKPIIGIPVFADQFSNIARAVKRGFGKHVDLSFSLPDDLKEAIEDIVNDPKYALKAKELSFVHHDRPVSPGKEIVHWSEHVIKTKGAPHLRSLALLVPWYQKIYLDLAMVLVLAVISIILIVILVYKLIKCVLCSKESKKTENNKKKTKKIKKTKKSKIENNNNNIKQKTKRKSNKN